MEALPTIEVLNLDEALDRKPYGATYGKLENGLTYYVRCNPRPKMRASLALVVKVGSVLEEEHEHGIAHVIEHLAFSATKKYENHEIVKFLESIGAEYGACSNAYTSFDETVYELFVPIDKPGILSEAISILSEICSEIRISQEDLEKERGAVLEEYRQRRNADNRQSEASVASILQGSKYAERFPIGLENVIRTVPVEVARGFYKKWYNLKNMAVVAVGDFLDTESVIDLIREHFGVKLSPEPPPALSFGVPFHEETRFTCLAEPEATGTTVEINWKMLSARPNTVGDYRDQLVEAMFFSALNRRFTKISHRKDPPYFRCSASCYEPILPVKCVEFTSCCKAKGTLEALKSMLTELAKIRLHKFSEPEIYIACVEIMSDMESSYLEREKMTSSSWRCSYVQHFLWNKAVLGLDFEAQLYKTILPQISATEVSLYSAKLLKSQNCVIITTEPRATVTVKDLEDLLSEVNSLEEIGEISPWEEDFIPDEIVKVKPNAGEIIKQSEYQDIGATELILSNGLKVCYKCTDFQNDEVYFEGYANGGLSELLEDDYLSCASSFAIAREFGEFGYEPTVFWDILAGKRAWVWMKLHRYSRMFAGYCSPSDLETALQLVYQLFMTRVEPKDERFETYIKRYEEDIHADERDPYQHFSERLVRVKYGNSYFYKSTRVSDLGKIDPKKACDYFDQCFKDPSAFTIVIVGNVNPSVMNPLILKYLGGLPKPPEPILHFGLEDLRAMPRTPPKHYSVREIVRVPMVDPQCSVHICFNVKLPKETMMEEMRFVGFLTQLLQTKLYEVLRFKQGEIYYVTVSLSFDIHSTSGDVEGEINIDFSCDPTVSAAVVDVALNEILRLQEHGPSEEDVSAVLEIEQRSHENGLQDNRFWQHQLIECYQSKFYSGDLGSTFQAMDKERSRVRQSLTPLTAKWALQRILPYPCKRRYITLTLVPETRPFQLIIHRLMAQFKQIIMLDMRRLWTKFKRFFRWEMM